VQQYQIDIDPDRLRSYAIPLSTVVRAVMASNSNVGGNVVSANGSWSIVRGLGLIENLNDIRNIVVASHNGTPVYVKDVGTVQVGNAFRTAALVKDTREAVGGVVVARTGENTKQVIDRVKQKILELQPGLPPGVHIVPFYDRSELIEATVDTPNFKGLLVEYHSLISDAVRRHAHHDHRRALLIDFLRKTFGIEVDEIELEKKIKVAEARGRIDAFYKFVIFEVKVHLDRERDDAFGGDGGSADQALVSLNLLYVGLVYDSAGYLYFSDYSNNRVRRVSPHGIITTFAGNGSAASAGDGGAAVDAALFHPYGLAIDAGGNNAE
jgi:hypothetical protein